MPRQTVKRRKVKFEFEAIDAKSVYLSGDFNSWDLKTHAMKTDNNGVWRKTLMLPPGEYEYKFFVDGSWKNDPNNTKVCLNSFGTRNNLLQIS